MKPIRERRRKIDGIDARLVELLNARTRLAIEIARYKRTSGMKAVSPARERAILRRVRQASVGPLDAEAIARLFRAILNESRRAAALRASTAACGPYR